MQSLWVKLGVSALGIAVAVVLLVVLSGGEGDGGTEPTQSATEVGSKTVSPASGGDDDGTGSEQPETAKPEIETIDVRGGEPVGGVAELDYKKGDRVRFRVRSDVTEEVHVHGYDVTKDVGAGGSVKFDFPADIDGLFEVELEQSHTELATLRVSP